MRPGDVSRDARILIVGAGAAGLCTAWYLKRAGFRHVKVLERSLRLGGKCRSVTVDSESFDLGANYVTSAYARVCALAAHVGATLYTERPGHVIDVKTGAMRSILGEVLRRTPLPVLLGQSLRYLWKRWRVRKLLNAQDKLGRQDLKNAFFDNFGLPYSVCRPPRIASHDNLSATVAMVIMEPATGEMEVAPLPALNKTFTCYSLTKEPRLIA